MKQEGALLFWSWCEMDMKMYIHPDKPHRYSLHNACCVGCEISVDILYSRSDKLLDLRQLGGCTSNCMLIPIEFSDESFLDWS